MGKAEPRQVQQQRRGQQARGVATERGEEADEARIGAGPSELDKEPPCPKQHKQKGYKARERTRIESRQGHVGRQTSEHCR